DAAHGRHLRTVASGVGGEAAGRTGRMARGFARPADRCGLRSDPSRASETVDDRDARSSGWLVAFALCRALPRAGGRAAAHLPDSVADAVRGGAAWRREADGGGDRGTRRLRIASRVRQGFQATDWR